MALLASGILTFVSTALLFPVATRWGTFLHASGPLLVALLVMAVLGSDALLARISRMRGWRQANVVIGPITLIVIAAVLGSLQLSLVADQSRGRQARYTALASAIASVAEQEGQSVPATSSRTTPCGSPTPWTVTPSCCQTRTWRRSWS